MDRIDKIRSLLNPDSTVGVEIGPLDKPIVRRSEGTIYYVDHLPTEELRLKYEHDPAVDNDRIEHVDFVWGESGLPNLLGDLVPVDYVVASHVVEHVPDFVGWLQETAAALATGGILALAIPDQRFTFDAARPCSTSADLVGAYLEHARRPSPRQVFEYLSRVVVLDTPTAWAGPLKAEELPRHHTIDQALSLARASAEGQYVDAHCWVFTPETFVALVGELVEIGELDFAVAKVIPTARNELEFFVSLTKLDPNAQDNRQVQRDSVRAALRSLEDAETPEGQHEPASALLRRQLEECAATLAERDARLEEIARSTSWRITGPVRFLGQMLRRRRM